MFGSTECGPMLISPHHADPRGGLKPLPGTKYIFPTVDQVTASANDPPVLELIVSSESPDLPSPSFLEEDNTFHTGDLFSIVSRGFYESRGRDDDWIKSFNSLRCDAKAIEDNVRQSCGDLVLDCVTVC